MFLFKKATILLMKQYKTLAMIASSLMFKVIAIVANIMN